MLPAEIVLAYDASVSAAPLLASVRKMVTESQSRYRASDNEFIGPDSVLVAVGLDEDPPARTKYWTAIANADD